MTSTNESLSPNTNLKSNPHGLLFGHRAGSEYMGGVFKPSTMAKIACTGEHCLPFHKIGRKVVYVKSELDAWLTARLNGGAK